MTDPVEQTRKRAEQLSEAIQAGRHFSKQLDGVPAIALDDALVLCEAFDAEAVRAQRAEGQVARVEACLADPKVTYGVVDIEGAEVEAITPLMTETDAIRAALASQEQEKP